MKELNKKIKPGSRGRASGVHMNVSNEGKKKEQSQKPWAMGGTLQLSFSTTNSVVTDKLSFRIYSSFLLIF